MEVFGWLWLFESYVPITVNYPLFIVIAIALVAVNLIIHARSANFRAFRRFHCFRRLQRQRSCLLA